MDRKALPTTLLVTAPVLMGYLAIGITFGLMFQEIGYNFIWAFSMSLAIYAGSGQYLGVTPLGVAVVLSTVVVMTLLISLQRLVYGLSMLEKFRGMGPRKLYTVFSPTNKTYALLLSARTPIGVDPRNSYLAIAPLDQSYWILDPIIGAVAGALTPFNTERVDLAMAALFVVIVMGQWRSYRRRLPAILRAGVTVPFPVILGHFFGQDQMLLISLSVIALCLLILRDRLDEEEEETC